MSKKEKINNIVKFVWSLICAKIHILIIILIIIVGPISIEYLIYIFHTTSIQSNKDIKQSFKISNFVEYNAEYKNC